MVPGSDEEDEDFDHCNENENEEDSIDDLLSHLSIADGKNKQRKEKAEVPLQIVESTEELEAVEYNSDDDDIMKIDIICQNNVPDPRGGTKLRTRLCFRAILPSGIYAETINVKIERELNQVVLTGEFIKGLSDASQSMCDLFGNDHFDLAHTYQDYLNN